MPSDSSTPPISQVYGFPKTVVYRFVEIVVPGPVQTAVSTAQSAHTPVSALQLLPVTEPDNDIPGNTSIGSLCWTVPSTQQFQL